MTAQKCRNHTENHRSGALMRKYFFDGGGFSLLIESDCFLLTPHVLADHNSLSKVPDGAEDGCDLAHEQAGRSD